jgi:hypothetical protein
MLRERHGLERLVVAIETTGNHLKILPRSATRLGVPCVSCSPSSWHAPASSWALRIPSSLWSQQARRCCRTSAIGWHNGRRSALRAWAAAPAMLLMLKTRARAAVTSYALSEHGV